MERDKQLEHTKFLALIYAITINQEDYESVNRLNDTLKIYNELRNPEIAKNRENFANKTEKDMETIFGDFDKFIEGMNNDN